MSPNMECAICLQHCVHPVQLPCSHVFCYLCVKGVANQSKRCAMCRQEIPFDYLDNPQLLDCGSSKQSCAFEDGYLWFYEGRNGWWQYDERTSAELEIVFKKGDEECELLIAGFLYTIDFKNMVQMRRNDPSRRRKIKRDLASIPAKGVAGLRTDNLKEVTDQNSSSGCIEREGAYGESQQSSERTSSVSANSEQDSSSVDPTESNTLNQTVSSPNMSSNDTMEDDTQEYILEEDYGNLSHSIYLSENDCNLSSQSTNDGVYASYPSDCSSQSFLRLSMSDENIQSHSESIRGESNPSLLVSYSDGELQRKQSTRH